MTPQPADGKNMSTFMQMSRATGFPTSSLQYFAAIGLLTPPPEARATIDGAALLRALEVVAGDR